MLEKLLKDIFPKPINLELEMRKLRNQLNTLQIEELEMNKNYFPNLKDSLTKNNEKQYDIIDTLFIYQKNNPDFQYN